MFSLLSKFLFLLLFPTWCKGFWDYNGGKIYEQQKDCFCQLSGKVDDCCCTVQDVDKLNNYAIHPKLTNLVARNYFRFVKLRLHRDCLFWSDWHQCALKDCSVDICNEEELPPGFKASIIKQPKILSTKDHKTEEKPCSVSDEEVLGELDTTLSESQLQNLQDWSNHDSNTSFCINLEEDSDDADWIDLLLNPEQYTGYRGDGPHQIWNSIYNENCFLPNQTMNTHDDFKTLFLSRTCFERRVFYRLISGLHASINIHLSYKYLLSDPRLPTKPKWGPNLQEFLQRFGAKETNGKGPHWLKNVYFTYLLTLRAVVKAAPYWKEAVFYTGNDKEDQEVKQIILELIKSSKACPSTFDESLMFTGDKEKAQNMMEEFRLHYKNITRIMDCVGCEKCRLWGKLQTYGIGTALKILFSSDNWDEIPYINGEKFMLSRTEVVALINALNKLSASIHIINEFKKMEQRTRNTKKELKKKTI